MTNLDNRSNIGPLRYLVNLRLKQDRAIKIKDREIKTLRAMKEELNKRIILVDLKLGNASLDNHSQPRPTAELAALRQSNEDLRRKIETQSSHIAELTKESDELKADSGNRLRQWRKMKEQDIGVKSPMPTPARPSSSQSSPVIVMLGGPSVTSQSTESPSLSHITKKSYASGTTSDGKGMRDALAVRISWRLPEATAADVDYQLQEESGDNVAQSSSVRENTLDSTSHRHTPTGPKNKASSSTHPTVRLILRSRDEAPYDADHDNENDIGTHVGVPTSGISRRIANGLRSPLDWRTDDIESGTCGGIHDPWQGQAPVMEGLDAPSRWRMDLWNASFAAKQAAGQVIEKPRER
jgi:hypothetical protein